MTRLITIIRDLGIIDQLKLRNDAVVSKTSARRRLLDLSSDQQVKPPRNYSPSRLDAPKEGTD